MINSPDQTVSTSQSMVLHVPKGSRPAKPRAEAARKALAAGRLPSGAVVEALPRLRFDRVAQRVVRDLQATLRSATPTNAVLIVTVTAPIRLPARTVAELGRQLASPVDGNFDKIICGNRVRARMVRRCIRGAPKVVVFIHNPDPDPAGLFELAEELLSAPPRRSGSGSTR